jgi:hypothetical protein
LSDTEAPQPGEPGGWPGQRKDSVAAAKTASPRREVASTGTVRDVDASRTPTPPRARMPSKADSAADLLLESSSRSKEALTAAASRPRR